MMKLKLLLLTILMSVSAMAQEAYVLNSNSQLEPMMRSVTNGNRVSGKALLAAYGAKLTTSLVIDGKRADLTLPMGATYFYVYTPTQIPIKSWKLAGLKKGKGNTRDLPYMKSGAYSGTTTKIDEIDIIYTRMSDNVYRISPAEPLKRGEYAFFRLESGVPAEVYDFRIDPSLSPALTIPGDEKVLALFNSKDNVKPRTSDNSNDNLMAASAQLLSDVDRDIPQTDKKADITFALIISNEEYKQAENVPYALNDGKVFEQYCKLALGLPEKHVTHIENASLSDIKYQLNKIASICDAYEGTAKIIVHYSGHGIPDEKTGEGYILPVDGYVNDPTTALKLSDLYSTLGNMNTKNTVVFLDACFSGTQKSGDMLASARGVAIKVKKDAPSKNLVVFSAAQGDETAYPYAEKQHGLMTYFLLKKLQESNGKATLGELSDYITTNVKKIAIVENGKAQTPTTTADPTNNIWRNISLR